MNLKSDSGETNLFFLSVILLLSAGVLMIPAGCFYGNVKTGSTDRSVMPYTRDQVLIFQSDSGESDTLLFIRKKIKTSSVDHFIDRSFGHTSSRRKPYIESYGTKSNFDPVRKSAVP